MKGRVCWVWKHSLHPPGGLCPAASTPVRCNLCVSLLRSFLLYPPNDQNRSKVTGRVVPQDLLERTIRNVPASFKLLKDRVDFAVEIRNAGPEGTNRRHRSNDTVSAIDNNDNDVQIVEPPMSWDEFRKRWGPEECPPGQHDRVVA